MLILRAVLVAGLAISLVWHLTINLVRRTCIQARFKEPQSMLILPSPCTPPVHFSVYQFHAPSTAVNECCVSLEGSEFGSLNCARR